MATNEEERERVNRAVRGDADAFEELTYRYGPIVHAVLLARVPPQAAGEMTSEVLQRAAKNVRSVPEPAEIGAWFANLARHRAEQVPQADRGGGAVLRTLGSLDEADREAVLMRLAESLGDREIARATARTVAEVEEAHRRGDEAMGDERPRLEAMLRALRWSPPAREEEARKTSALRFVVPAVVVLAVVAVALIFAMRPRKEEGPRITWTAGQTGTQAFAVGDALETKAGERARITLEEGLSVEVEPYSSMTQKAPKPDGHRYALDLAEGLIHVEIEGAEPSLVVQVGESAVTVDEPARVTLDVNPEGEGEVSVTSGGATVGDDERPSVFVPVGARCFLSRNGGPGVPYFDDAAPELKGVAPEADSALAAALAATRPKDTLTLFHLLPRVDENTREVLILKLQELAPLPEGVTAESLGALEEGPLSTYEKTLRPLW